MAMIGFIGMGNMGYAMMKGALQAFPTEELLFTCPHHDKCARIQEETGVAFADSNAELANRSKYVILAVKPQMYATVLDNIKDVITEKHVIISLAPGITIQSVQESLGESVRVVRAMPNTPALVGEGMTGISLHTADYNENELALIRKFFQSFGKAVTVPEQLMSAVVCASGSSPAYVYMFIEALADSVVKYGIPRKDAYELAAQTVLGSAKMVLETGMHPAKLKDDVCSPGGTTMQGVAALEAFGFRNAIIQATDKCYEKCTKIK